MQDGNRNFIYASALTSVYHSSRKRHQEM